MLHRPLARSRSFNFQFWSGLLQRLHHGRSHVRPLYVHVPEGWHFRQDGKAGIGDARPHQSDSLKSRYLRKCIHARIGYLRIRKQSCRSRPSFCRWTSPASVIFVPFMTTVSRVDAFASAAMPSSVMAVLFSHSHRKAGSCPTNSMPSSVTCVSLRTSCHSRVMFRRFASPASLIRFPKDRVLYLRPVLQNAEAFIRNVCIREAHILEIRMAGHPGKDGIDARPPHGEIDAGDLPAYIRAIVTPLLSRQERPEI